MTNNVNIENEYNNYISGKWQKLSKTTQHAFKMEKDGASQNYVNAMSMWTIKFLQDKLNKLETETK